ncbi:MAG: S24/S26 family peptidase [Deltaproteobacteria bacterium]|nr:S24/S26 family peptidase [Deltaproteobacteria bacterium]
MPPLPDSAHLLLVGQLLRQRGWWDVTVTTGSMRPTIPVGARVRVVASNRVKLGEVAALAIGDRVYIHRVLARFPTPMGTMLVHGGDAPQALPSFVFESRLIGRADVPRKRISVPKRLASLARAALVYLRRRRAHVAP